ncbi:MAG: outer membrane lipoprotein LolB [Betaproteobacteria bacterium]|nr:outer membrane lipoprotein LolB [Betaproteobacteria bacterium]
MRIFASAARAGVAAVLLLAGCATAPAEPPTTAEPMPVGPGHDYFTLSGRLSVRDGQRVEIATLRWERTASGEVLTLGSPLGSTVARLSQPAGGSAELVAGDRKTSALDMEALTADALGTSVPLRALGWWLQGLSGRVEAGRRVPTGAAFEHEGWDIRIEEFPLSAAAPVARRIVARRGDIALRLVVDEWLPRT